MSEGLVASTISNRVKFSMLSAAKRFYTEVVLMSNQARREYLIAIIDRYQRAGKAEKTKILDEFCKVCGYGRKYAIWLLSNDQIEKKLSARRRVKKYPEELLLPHVKFLWFALEQVSARRMKKAFEVWLPRYKQNEVTPQIKYLLSTMSASTLDRLISKLRVQMHAKKRYVRH